MLCYNRLCKRSWFCLSIKRRSDGTGILSKIKWSVSIWAGRISVPLSLKHTQMEELDFWCAISDQGFNKIVCEWLQHFEAFWSFSWNSFFLKKQQSFAALWYQICLCQIAAGCYLREQAQKKKWFISDSLFS